MAVVTSDTSGVAHFPHAQAVLPMLATGAAVLWAAIPRPVETIEPMTRLATTAVASPDSNAVSPERIADPTTTSTRTAVAPITTTNHASTLDRKVCTAIRVIL